jgi:putative flippase GtrA
MSRLGAARAPLAFVGVGLLSAAVDAGTFSLAFALGVVAPVASALGFVAAFGVNYSGNRVLVFQVRHSGTALRRYVVLVTVNLLLTTGLVAGLVATGLEAHVAKGISMVVIACFNFVAMRSWVFRSEPVSPG